MGTAPVGEREACLRWLCAACRLWLLKKQKESRNAASAQNDRMPASRLDACRTGFGRAPCKSISVSAPRETSEPPSSLEGSNDHVIVPEVSSLNADILRRMAYVQGLEPLLHDLIRRNLLRKPDLPPPLVSEWERAYFNNVIRNTSLFDIFGQILSACEAQHIPLVGLKGLSATASIYKDPGLRVMADIDLICRPSDLPALRRIVISLGFLERSSLQAHHLTFYHKELGFPLEFHFGLQYAVKNRKALLSLFWDRCRASAIEELRFSILSPEDSLIFDLAHALDHVYLVPLKNFLDIMAGLLFFQNELDWDYLEAALRRSRLTEEFGTLGTALSGLFGIPLQTLQIPIRPDRPPDDLSEVENLIRSNLLSMGFDTIPRSGSRLRSYASALEKTGFALSYLFPPLPAVQAAYNRPSLLSSAFFFPLHLLIALRDFRKRKERDAAVAVKSNLTGMD